MIQRNALLVAETLEVFDLEVVKESHRLAL